jgi:hypothetical protein
MPDDFFRISQILVHWCPTYHVNCVLFYLLDVKHLFDFSYSVPQTILLRSHHTDRQCWQSRIPELNEEPLQRMGLRIK